MKVGTDGVLLGAWTPLDRQPKNILDIGAGTGLIALMLAQRSLAETIDAIEIEEAAYEQCVENFEASPWADRLFCYHAGLDEMAEELEDPYELIVSNPPFYKSGSESGDKARDRARQNSALPFGELLFYVDQLLSPNGFFCSIIPCQEEAGFLDLARGFNLYPFKITRVKGNFESEVKRSLLVFSRTNQACEEELLVIEKQRHVYTEAYKELCRDFYLKL
ncbi:methyltransferase domain-containing protein [Muriicola soli]|uniref:tRNA1(Val) (adenine(37)-N6)-methyltransferase n=2 Tax=Muriicola soli TaxID=2507538 RepID=A0A411ED82_9FLAO|nr:methyltransferase domain-containing protein [Muriicola soli]